MLELEVLLCKHTQCGLTAWASRYFQPDAWAQALFLCVTSSVQYGVHWEQHVKRVLMPISGSLLWLVLKINTPAFSKERVLSKTQRLTHIHTHTALLAYSLPQDSVASGLSWTCPPARRVTSNLLDPEWQGPHPVTPTCSVVLTKLILFCYGMSLGLTECVNSAFNVSLLNDHFGGTLTLPSIFCLSTVDPQSLVHLTGTIALIYRCSDYIFLGWIFLTNFRLLICQTQPIQATW